MQAQSQYNKKLKLIYIGLLTSLVGLAGCNGAINGNQNKTNNLGKSIPKLTRGQLRAVTTPSNKLSFDLGNAELLTEQGQDQVYTYRVQLLGENTQTTNKLNGSFTCSSEIECKIELNEPSSYGNYVIEIFKDNKFIGAGTFNYTGREASQRQYPSFALSADSTGTYLLARLAASSNANSNQDLITFDQTDELARAAFKGYDQNYNIYTLCYLYLQYLINQQKLSYEAALNKWQADITNNHVDTKFLQQGVADYKAYLLKYNKLDNDSSLAIASEKFKKFNDTFGKHLNSAGTVAGVVFPQAGAVIKATTQGLDYGSKALDIIADISGSKSALAELTTLQDSIRQKGIETSQSVETLMQKLVSIMQKSTANNYYTKFNNSANIIMTYSNQLNNLIRGYDIDDFIQVQTEEKPQIPFENFTVLLSKNSGAGVFNQTSLRTILEQVEIISEPVQLEDLIEAIKDKGLDLKEDNLIAKRKVINSQLSSLYFKITDALLNAYQIEKMAIYLSEKSKYSHQYFYGAVAIAEQLPNATTYDERQAALKAIFAKRIANVHKLFSGAMLNLYEGVPNFSVLYQQACDVTSLNSEHTIIGTSCPAQGKTKKVKDKLQFADSINGGAKTECMINSIHANSDGHLSCALNTPGEKTYTSTMIFNYLNIDHMTDPDKAPNKRYSVDALLIKLPSNAKTKIISSENMHIEEQPKVTAYSVGGCNDSSHIFYCSAYKYYPSDSYQLDTPALVLDKVKFVSELIMDSYETELILKNKHLAVMALNYQGVDFPLTLTYTADAMTSNHFLNANVELQCQQSYPVCKKVGKSLQFTTEDNKVTTVSIQWETFNNGLKFPQLTINP